MQTDAVLRLPQVLELTGYSKAEIYRRIQAGTFPRQRRKSHKCAVWSRNEVTDWVQRFLHG